MSKRTLQLNAGLWKEARARQVAAVRAHLKPPVRVPEVNSKDFIGPVDQVEQIILKLDAIKKRRFIPGERTYFKDDYCACPQCGVNNQIQAFEYDCAGNGACRWRLIVVCQSSSCRHISVLRPWTKLGMRVHTE